MSRSIVLVALLGILLAVSPTSRAEPDLVAETVKFSFVASDVIPGVAAVNAACEIVASGESLRLLNGQADGTSIAAAPGPCSIVLILFGVEVPLPILNTTPLGRNSFYIPGLAVVTFGLVDVSVDLVSALNSSIRVVQPEAAVVDPQNLSWTAWGARRVLVNATAGYGDVLETSLETSFTWSVSLSLTVWALSVPVYAIGLTSLGSFAGSAPLATGLSVDLIPTPVELVGPSDLRHDGATFRWNASTDTDIDRYELLIDDGESVVAWILPDPTSTSVRVGLHPETHYTATLRAVDGVGQSSSSVGVSFRTPAAPVDVASQAIDPMTWTLLLLLGLASVVAYSVGWLRGRKAE